MKTIKVKYVGFWPNFDPEDFFLTKIMRKKYIVSICEDPDYVICSGFGLYEYLGYDQVRIFFSGENYVPDFNYVDYALSVYPLTFGDRHFSFPGLVVGDYNFLMELSRKDRNYSKDILDEKPLFANMIASHESERNLRGDFVRLLSQYKRVECAGPLCYNMPNMETVRTWDGTKLALQKKCKFTFCGESMAHEGFITEKIFDALLADTIPIYYGSSTISQIVNKKAYIDVRDFDSMQAVANKIIELDQDDEKYLNMLSQPIFVQSDYVEQKVSELESFIYHIFDQPIEEAYRRSRLYMPARYEKCLIQYKNSKYNKNSRHKREQNVKAKAVRLYWRIFDRVIALKRRYVPSQKNR